MKSLSRSEVLERLKEIEKARAALAFCEQFGISNAFGIPSKDLQKTYDRLETMYKAMLSP